MPLRYMQSIVFVCRVFSFTVLASILAVASVRAESSSLVDALKGRDTTAALDLVKQGTDVNTAEADGATALHWAAHFNDIAAADALLAAGAQVNIANDYGVTPLMLAAENGSADMVGRLLTAGAKTNATMPSGETALMTASRAGDVGTVSWLLSKGANPNLTENRRGQTALIWALAESHNDVVSALIGGGADVNSKSNGGFTPVMTATRYNNLEALRLLLEQGGNLHTASKDGTTALHIAAVRGHVDMAKFLLAQGADPNNASAGYTPLHYAVGKWDGVDAYEYSGRARHGIHRETDAPGEWKYLLGLDRAERLDLIEALFEHGADPNVVMTKEPPRYGFSLVAGHAARHSTGGTAFLIAAMGADVELMRLLVENGANPHAVSKIGTTAIMMAAGMAWMEYETLTGEADYLEALQYVASLGVDLDAQNSSGDTALHGTVQQGSQPYGFNKVVMALYELGADINIKNKRGQTPLKITRGYGAAGGQHVRLSTDALLVAIGGTE